MKDKELKLEETEASHTLGGAGEGRIQHAASAQAGRIQHAASVQADDERLIQCLFLLLYLLVCLFADFMC